MANEGSIESLECITQCHTKSKSWDVNARLAINLIFSVNVSLTLFYLFLLPPKSNETWSSLTNMSCRKRKYVRERLFPTENCLQMLSKLIANAIKIGFLEYRKKSFKKDQSS